MFDDAAAAEAIDVEAHERRATQTGVAAMDGHQIAVGEHPHDLMVQVGEQFQHFTNALQAPRHEGGMVDEARGKVGVEHAGVMPVAECIMHADDLLPVARPQGGVLGQCLTVEEPGGSHTTSGLYLLEMERDAHRQMLLVGMTFQMNVFRLQGVSWARSSPGPLVAESGQNRLTAKPG